MESRSNKYYQDDYSNGEMGSRSSRNAKLYRQVYGKYEDLDNLPMEDNIDEIDMDKLKELVSLNKKKDDVPPIKENLNILEMKKRNIDEQKVYDINKLLEKAKYENNKLKEPVNNLKKQSRNILSTLETSDLSVDEIKKACKKYEDKVKQKEIEKKDNQDVDDSLMMTRELKYQTRQISTDPLIEQVMPTSDLSLDLLSDLKPTEDTIITKPIKDDNKKDVDLSDTDDINIIKKGKDIDDDFFTSSYQFSKNDFSDDDFLDKPKGGNVLKVILLILAIIIFAGVIFYFVANYGLGV